MATRLNDPAPAFVPKADRRHPVGPSRRAIACRSCGRWTSQGADLRWSHEDDGTLACVNPDSLRPYES